MKKIILMLCSVLVCCCLNVSANETDDTKACKALSNDEQVCSINKDGDCECEDISVNPLVIDRNDEGD